MRRFLVSAVTVCSLLWAVTGVSVLAIALHEHHHHPAEVHDHDDTFELVLHCHDNDGTPHHDHELKAPMSASRTSWSNHVHSMTSQTSDVVDTETGTVRFSAVEYSEPRDLGPPAYLMLCVLLT